MLVFRAGQAMATAALVATTALAPAQAVKIPISAAVNARTAVAGQPALGGHKIRGFVQSLSGNTLVIKNRAGRTFVVNTQSAHADLYVFPGRPVIVFFAAADASGTIQATAVWRTFPNHVHWPPDR
jgi:hypothetical protein